MSSRAKASAFARECRQCSASAFGNGLEARLAAHEARASSETERLRLRQQVKQLTLPNEMGERFQVMGFARGVEFERAFAHGDSSHRL